ERRLAAEQAHRARRGVRSALPQGVLPPHRQPHLRDRRGPPRAHDADQGTPGGADRGGVVRYRPLPDRLVIGTGTLLAAAACVMAGASLVLPAGDAGAAVVE